MDVARTDHLATRKRRRIALGTLGGLLVASAAAAIVTLGTGAASADRDALLIGTVRRGEFVREVRGPGVLVPRDVRWLAAQAPARVERILVRPGATVAADTIVVQLSNPELERVVEEAEAALVQGDAELAARRLELASQVLDQKSRVAEVVANFESTRLQAEAERDAASIHAVSRLQAQRSRLLADQLKVRVDVEQERLANLRAATQAQLRAEAARVDQLRGSFTRQRELLASLAVRAGMDGVLQSMPVQVGQQLAVGAPIARVARPDGLIAELRIPELAARDLALGQSARIDTRGGVIDGRVARIDPGVENGTVRVEVELPRELPAGARPDLSVDGTIQIERVPDALFVERLATAEPESVASVFKLDSGGGRAHRVRATLGKSSVRDVAVVAGLAPGDRVIVSDTSQWSNYDELRLH